MDGESSYMEVYENNIEDLIANEKKKFLSFVWIICCICVLVVPWLTSCGNKHSSNRDYGSQTELIRSEVEDDEQNEETAYIENFEDAKTEISEAIQEKNQEGSEEAAKLIKNDIIALPEEEKEYTIMIYMIGSNLESRYASATSDIEEMEAANVDYKKNNVLIYAGGSRRWNNDISAGKNSILDLSLEKNNRIVASTALTANMAVPETLSAFINFSKENYPAKHYGIIFWDHGAGPLWGYGNDELFNNDSLLLDEMVDALEKTDFNNEHKLDFVGFDACLMGSLETMTIWSNYADYYIGSEELEPGQGWDYAFLSVLNETSDAKLIAKKIVETYGQFYEDAKTDTSNPDVTLSCADLSKVAHVQSALTELSQELSSGSYIQLQRDRSLVKSFGLVESTKGGTFSYDLMDLGDFADTIGQSYPQKSKRLLDSIDELILYQYSNIENTSGVTIYYPYSNKALFTEMSEAYNRLGINHQYTSFLEKMTQTWLKSLTRDWQVPEPEMDTEKISLQLTEDMLAHTTEVYYYIITNMEDGCYFPIISRAKATPDENGCITLPTDPDLYYITTNTGEKEFWPVTQIESNEERNVWHAGNMRLASNIHFGFETNDSEFQNVDVLMQQDLETNELLIQSVSSDDGNASLGSKNTINLSQYEGVYWGYSDLIPTRDKMGRLLPITKWQTGDSIGYHVIPVDQGSMSFESQKSSTYLGELYYQIVIEDENRETYASELIPIQPLNKPEVVTEKTELGSIRYAIYDDHAEVWDYYGQDTKIEIKDEIEGKKVTAIDNSAFGRVALFETYNHNLIEEIILPDTITEIRSSAFLNCQDLKTISLPEHLSLIGSDAFAGCSTLTEIDIPDSVETIGKSAFSYCGSLEKIKLPKNLSILGTQIFMRSALKEIELSDQNENFKVVDGMLLSADGKTVYGSTIRGRDTLYVPDGVEMIASGAFYGSYEYMKKIKEVTLPSTLVYIGNYAFSDIVFAKAPQLPENLEYIGMYAFNASEFALKPETLPKDQSEIYIGSKVKYIGTGAFDMFANRQFKVSEINPYFADLEGCLTNKTKDTLTAIAYNGFNTIVIPEGILSFDVNMLEIYDIYGLFEIDHVDVFFPESVSYIEDTSALLMWDYFTFHCDQDSAAGYFADENDILISDEKELKTGEVIVDTPHGTMTFELFETHAALVSYDGTDAAIEVPEQVDGLTVTMIGNGRDAIQQDIDYNVQNFDEYDESSSLLEINLPESVTILQDRAFMYMSLTKMNIPNNLTYIGEQAIPSGVVLDTLPDSVEYMGAECIGSSDSFSENKFLLPSSLKYMAPDALSKCNIKAYELKIESPYFSVIDGALYSKDEVTLIRWPSGDDQEAVIPDGVIYIGPEAFRGTKIQRAVIPDSVIEIGENAFSYCWNLEEIEFGNGVEHIGNYAFTGCNQLEEIMLPMSTRSIGDYSFANCDNLKKISLNEGLRTLSSHVFENSDALKEIDLPNSLTGVDDYAIGSFGTPAYIRVKDDTVKLGNNFSALGDAGLSAIKSQRFEVADDNLFFTDVDGFLTDISGTVLLACPAGLKGNVYVPEGIYRIEAFAFYGCSEVTDIYIPDSVKSISSLAFDEDLYQTWVSGSDSETSGYVKNAEVVIHCEKDSAAEQFCRDENMMYMID